jgi:hypothetical protein
MKLSVELVPATCWFSNVRSACSKAQWDKIRKRVYLEAKHVCEVCGGVGPKHPVEAHEIWSYDDLNQIQKLVGMIALCPDCHQVKHFGLAQVNGKGEIALKHLMKVNEWTVKRAEAYIKTALKRWAERSEKKWKLDISHLSEYGIDTSESKER